MARGAKAAADGPRITAFVTWAHEHAGVDDHTWAETVFRLVVGLRRLGIEADIDLAHLNDDDVDWSTFGVRRIEESDYVLLVASSAYKDRWEGKADPKVGAGAAREANVLKALFGDDRAAFLRKLKVVVLPGVSVSDIPIELRASAQRFVIPNVDDNGLHDLLRTLTGNPQWLMPAVGELPDLPPTFMEGTLAANRESSSTAAQESRDDDQELRSRLQALDEALAHGGAPNESDLRMERATIQGALEQLAAASPVQVRVHTAVFVGVTPKECYFVNVLNASHDREITVTHVWFDTTPEIHVLNRRPGKIAPDSQWETWVEAASVPPSATGPEWLARVLLANGLVIRSVPRRNVPPAGFVPG